MDYIRVTTRNTQSEMKTKRES